MSWEKYLMGAARHAASKSKDSTKVGAVLVSDGNSILLTAFNGPPRYVEDKPERFERPTKYLFACHAEENLISFAARNGIQTEDKKVYVTHMPCARCARQLIQAGISEVVYGRGKTSMPEEEFTTAKIMFEEAGVSLWEYRKGEVHLIL